MTNAATASKNSSRLLPPVSIFALVSGNKKNLNAFL